MRALRASCGPFFVFAGLMHFKIPHVYKQIVPPYLPAPDAIVYASGVAEAAGGLALMFPKTRRRAGWWLLATLAAVFPANIEMALHPEKYPKIPGGATALKARLPFQAVFAAWVFAAMGKR
jgi:uncharacterized membrane protein